MLRPNTFICMNDGHLKMIGNGQGHHNSQYVAQRNVSSIYSTSDNNILLARTFVSRRRQANVGQGGFVARVSGLFLFLPKRDRDETEMGG